MSEEKKNVLRLSDITMQFGGVVAVNDLSLEINEGEIVSIIGPNGCGKSTLLKLLMRFWDVSQGSISVDGRDVKTVPTKALRDMESYVTQQTHLFHDSIANNIAIAKPGATAVWGSSPGISSTAGASSKRDSTRSPLAKV